MLISHSQVDLEEAPAEQIEAAEFLHWMDHEGGMAGLLHRDTWRAFPEELQDLAHACQDALSELRNGINDWAKQRGVYY